MLSIYVRFIPGIILCEIEKLMARVWSEIPFFCYSESPADQVSLAVIDISASMTETWKCHSQ